MFDAATILCLTLERWSHISVFYPTVFAILILNTVTTITHSSDDPGSRSHVACDARKCWRRGAPAAGSPTATPRDGRCHVTRASRDQSWPPRTRPGPRLAREARPGSAPKTRDILLFSVPCSGRCAGLHCFSGVLFFCRAGTKNIFVTFNFVTVLLSRHSSFS